MAGPVGPYCWSRHSLGWTSADQSGSLHSVDLQWEGRQRADEGKNREEGFARWSLGVWRS